MVKFSEKGILYRSGALTLAGVVMLPAGGLHPGAVFVHGSGNSDRANPWYQEIARYLASHSIAVLLPDKRGCHESEGDWRSSDFHDLAEDAIAGVNSLRAQDNVDPKSVGLIGISQGGWIAPIAAQMGDVAFVVSLSGATVTPREQFRHEVTQDIRQKGLPIALSYICFPIAQLFLERKWPRWPDVKDFDPMPLWETLPVPSLIVFGDEDEYDNVPVQESTQRLNVAIQRNPRTDLTVKVFQGSGHGLREPGTKHIRQDLLRLLTEWITVRV
jgi:dipeptidyl aminopeptidase/acylaminoacyl peptidase